MNKTLKISLLRAFGVNILSFILNTNEIVLTEYYHFSIRKFNEECIFDITPNPLASDLMLSGFY